MIRLSTFIVLLSASAVLARSRYWDEPQAQQQQRQRQQKSQIIVVGGQREGGSAYRYRNGFDKTNALGARKYEHNAGYGFADEIDNTNPNPSLTEWGKKYATAQSSTWGKVVPRVWRLAANTNLSPMMSSSTSNNNYNNNNNMLYNSNNNMQASPYETPTIFAAPKWVGEKLKSSRKPYKSNNNNSNQASGVAYNDARRRKLYGRENSDDGEVEITEEESE